MADSPWHLARARRRGATRLARLMPLLAMLGCGAQAQAPAESDGGAGVVWAECEQPAAAEARCGRVRVEENHAAPSGRTLDLAVIVAPSTARSPAPDPVFLLAGGPGQGAAALAPMILHSLDAIRAERDLVFVDIRGTGASNPLVCDFEDEGLDKLLSGEAELDLLDACLTRYEAEGGVDLTQYNTAAVVEDLEAVRAALGYEQINLFGISYGTAVAQVYMRAHGEHLRSAVLDGVVPLDRWVSLAMPANSEAALTKLLRDCSEDSACAAAFPGLERKLARVVAELETNRTLEQLVHPRTGEPVRIELSRAGFVATLGGALYSPALASLVPLAIERAHAGDYGPVAALALRMTKMSGSMSMGLYLSVACAEDLDTLSASTRAAAVAELEVFDDHNLAILEQACARWPHAALTGFHAPVASSVPTLLLSGGYDPVTPPAFGRHLAASLADARHIEVPNGSHGVWHLGCAPKLVASFFASPDPAAVDASCFDGLARPALFLNPNGPWPLEPRPADGHEAALAHGELIREP